MSLTYIYKCMIYYPHKGDTIQKKTTTITAAAKKKIESINELWCDIFIWNVYNTYIWNVS